MSNLAAYVCVGFALAFVIVAGVLSVSAGVKYWFGEGKGRGGRDYDITIPSNN